jgi:choline dehydrogenase-like flavoprotein
VAALPVQDRIKIIQGWSASLLWSFRGIAKSITSLGKLGYIRTSPSFPAVTGFPRVPSDWTPGATSYPYEFLQFATGVGMVEVVTDVVIIGSGCGAGVVANRLAKEFGGSVRVLVLEKGKHFDAKYFPLDQAAGLASMFEAGGVVESDDGSITVTAGSCFGGGGTVNWSASLKTQEIVLKEWAEISKLSFFEGPEFQACLDRVYEHMGCDPDVITPNHGNRVLLDGAKKLGLNPKLVPQNTGGKKHDCGYCTLGCWKGEKKGPVNGWFPEAAEKGTKFAQRFLAEKVVFEQNKGKKVAKGVQGVWTAEGGEKVPVIVRAKKVVVCCGTLWSPVVLMNSGIKVCSSGQYLSPIGWC